MNTSCNQKGNTFVFVCPDAKSGVVARQAKEVAVSETSGVPRLADILGLSKAQLAYLTYSSGTPVFNRMISVPYYHTTATITSILWEAGIKILTVSEKDVLEGELDHIKNCIDDTLAIGITTTFIFSTEKLDRLLTGVRRIFPRDIPVVIGGAGITLNHEWFPKVEADFMVTGDAEVTLPSLLMSLKSGGDFDGIPNLSWKGPNNTIMSNPVDSSFDMDSCPTTRWDLLDDKGQWPKTIWYETLRGCPFRCKFCSYPQQSPSVRTKSPQRMLEEFLYYASKGVTHINCFDSTMLTPMARMRKFCDLLIENGTPVTWSCFGHPSQLQSSAFCEQMFAAGCRYLVLGIESGSEQILQNMNKHISTPKALLAVQNVQNAGILCQANFIVGFPGETRETHETSVAFALESGANLYSAQTFQIRDERMPILAEASIFGLSLHRDDYGRPTTWTSTTMTSEEAAELCEEFHTTILKSSVPMISRIAAGSAGDLAGVDDLETARYRSNTIVPILKEYERALATHPEMPSGLVGRLEPCTYEQFEIHAVNVRSRFNEEIARGRLRFRDESIKIAV